MSGGAPSKLLQFLAAGAIVAVSSWDVHRKIRANSVPVTAEQWEDINQWKRDQKREIEQGRSFRVLEYLSKGGGGEEEGRAQDPQDDGCALCERGVGFSTRAAGREETARLER